MEGGGKEDGAHRREGKEQKEEGLEKEVRKERGKGEGRERRMRSRKREERGKMTHLAHWLRLFKTFMGLLRVSVYFYPLGRILQLSELNTITVLGL